MSLVFGTFREYSLRVVNVGNHLADRQLGYIHSRRNQQG